MLRITPQKRLQEAISELLKKIFHAVTVSNLLITTSNAEKKLSPMLELCQITYALVLIDKV